MQTVEIQTVLAQEGEIAVIGLDIFFMNAIDYQHIFWGELYTSYLSTYQRDEHLQTYHFILTHVQGAR